MSSGSRDFDKYCRGPYCVMSAEAVETLREHDREAVRLEDGVPEWRKKGHSVISSAWRLT